MADCCPEPGCPSVTLLCNSISASKSKCGLSNIELPGRFFLRADHTGTGSILDTSPGGTNVHFTYTGAYATWDLSGTGNCSNYTENSGTYSGSSSGTYAYTYNMLPCPFCGGTQNITTTVSGDSVTKECVDSHTTCTEDNTSTYAYSNEYTTATLKTNAAAALPSYADCFNCTSHSTDSACTNLITGQSCTCSAFRNLSTDETSYTIRRFKYKFRFTASVTCRLKILWNETFKPTLTSGVTFCSSSYSAGAEDPNPAHWTATAKSYTKAFSGNPCGPTTTAPTAPAGTIYQFDSGEYTVNEPSSNGTTYVTDLRWTILDGNNDTDAYDPTAIDYTNPCSPVATGQNCIPVA